MKNILILSPVEICYQPRLIKSADYFLSRGCNVFVSNTITGSAPRKIYKDFKKSKSYIFFENHIDKHTLLSKFKWLLFSLFHKFFETCCKLNLNLGFNYALNKGVIGLRIPKNNYDIILINLVDSLPKAVSLKMKYKIPVLIYDSQEYFAGQYSKYESEKYKWVVKAERINLPYVDIAICTTNVMKSHFIDRHSFEKPIFRVRNISNTEINPYNSKQSSKVLRLIWHGMSINYGNCRGVHIIVQAVAKCKTPVKLYLQGKKVEIDYRKLMADIDKMDIRNRVEILKPVSPELIVKSITEYDIGLTGELPEEENQILTSSNKLFDYIKAGLAVISSDLPGLRETIDEYKTGLLYSPGNIEMLAEAIDLLNTDRVLLNVFKQASISASKNLSWNNDFQFVWNNITDVR